MSDPTPDGGQRDPAAEPLTVIPRVLAGPGEPATALEVLDAAGWTSHTDTLANVHAHSPDRRMFASFWPEARPDGRAPSHPSSRWWPERPDAVLAGRCVADRLGMLWLAKAYTEPFDGTGLPDPAWVAAFGEDIPAELVAAFLNGVVDPTRHTLDAAQTPGAGVQVLDAAGWRVEPGTHGGLDAYSPDAALGQPDHRVLVRYRPDHPDATGRAVVERLAPLWRSAWQVEIYREPERDPAPVWAAAFSHGIPTELVAAFLTAVVDPAGIQRDPLELHTVLRPPAPATT